MRNISVDFSCPYYERLAASANLRQCICEIEDNLKLDTIIHLLSKIAINSIVFSFLQNFALRYGNLEGKC